MSKQRADRISQAKHRCAKRSYKTELENVQLLLAMEAAELSEGQVSAALNTDRVAVRMLRDGAIAAGCALAERPAEPDKITETMKRAIGLAKSESGELVRQPGGFWVRPSEFATLWPKESYGTPTANALVRRGIAEYTEWKAGRSGRFPIRMKLTPQHGGTK